MSFWRYKLLEILLALATFPFAVIAFLLWAGVFSQFADLTSGGKTFFVFAIPFLVCWALFQNWLTKRVERWWLSRQKNADARGRDAVRH